MTGFYLVFASQNFVSNSQSYFLYIKCSALEQVPLVWQLFMLSSGLSPSTHKSFHSIHLHRLIKCPSQLNFLILITFYICLSSPIPFNNSSFLTLSIKFILSILLHIPYKGTKSMHIKLMYWIKVYNS